MQAFDRGDGAAVEDDSVAHGLHPEHADLLLHEPRHHLVPEAPEVSVHDVERHAIFRVFQTQPDRVFVPREPDVPDKSVYSRRFRD